jgi:hypothetical protein
MPLGSFTEGLGNELLGECGNELLGECGNEKFCTIRNLPVLPGLGIIERGEDWNGPIKFLSVFSLKGPINLPFSSSF